MIPRLLDVAAFKAVASLSETDFSNYAALGMLPRAVGLYRGAAVWSDENVGEFVRLTLKRDPAPFDDDAVAVATVPVAVADETRATATVDDGKPLFFHAEFLNQLQAADYMSVSPGWVKDRVNDGLLPSTKEWGVMVYKRADLDALMTLPVYTLRKRKGYAHGKPVKENSREKRERIEREAHEARQVAPPSAVLSRRGAADFLGISVEELAIMERDRLGPAYSGMGYRVADLEAFKSQHMKRDERGEPWIAKQVMEYLGVSLNTLRTWGINGKGPKCVKMAFDGKSQRVYDSKSVEAYAREHAADLAKIKKLAQHAREEGLGVIARAARDNRRRVAKQQAQKANTPKPKKSVASKVKASKSPAKSAAKPTKAKPSPYARNGTRAGVAGRASARA